MIDIREQIYTKHMERQISAILVAEADGILSGIERGRYLMEKLGLAFFSVLKDGFPIREGKEILRVEGNPIQIAMAEEQIIGILSKSSGIATAASRFKELAGSDMQVIAGGWKKMPMEIKDIIREAVHHGGIKKRISEKPFVYLDKNYVRILGGVGEAVEAVRSLKRQIVLQIKGETAPIEEEAIIGAKAGASVIMVDTGRDEHLTKVITGLRQEGFDSRVRIAFAGGISLDQMGGLTRKKLDIVDIGYAILDAPCLPMRFDVINVS